MKLARCVHTGAPRRVNKRARRDSVYTCARTCVRARVSSSTVAALLCPSIITRGAYEGKRGGRTTGRREKIRCASIGDVRTLACGPRTRVLREVIEMFKFRYSESRKMKLD